MKNKFLIFILAFVMTFSMFAQSPSEVDMDYYTSDMPDWYGEIIRVADGDTFYIDFYSEVKMGIRVKGVDTPETKDRRKPVQHWGPEASAYAKEILLPGTIVRLEFEGEITGPFGRLLAYVWYWDGDEWINWQEQLLKSGNAFLYKNYKFEYPELYLQYQQYAIDNKLGMWADPDLIENEVVYSLDEIRWYK